MGIKRTIRRRLPERLIDDAAAKFVGQRVLARIRIRTFDKGKGRDGRNLPAYSPAYGALRGRLGLRTAPPDYTRTGRLRRSTRVRSIRKTRNGWLLRIGPTGHRLIVGARLNKRGAGWLGETPDEKRKTREDLRRAIQMTRQRDGGR